MISRSGKEGIDWVPKVTPDSPVDPKYFFGCKTVKELSSYYWNKKHKRFAIGDMVATVVGANDGFCDYPLCSSWVSWPQVSLVVVTHEFTHLAVPADIWQWPLS